MAEEKPKVANQISSETGQFDARFMLWRMFCSENDIPVETLPSALEGEARVKWDQIKNDQLHKPAEKNSGSEP
ncbi:MAG: hypothetical protein WCD76_04790 [Pyrinomonadaceae bacterium]